MNERCVRVVISGQAISEQGDQRVVVSVQCGASDHPVVVQVAALAPRAPSPLQAAAGAAEAKAPGATPALSLELRWSEPPPPRVEPERRCEPAPLAAAWALAQWLRQREAAMPTPRHRSVRVPHG
jgi:hypothetical protein